MIALSNISVGVEFSGADPSFFPGFLSWQVSYAEKLREVLDLVRRKRQRLAVVRQRAWCNLHNKKVSGFYVGLLLAGEAEEGRGGQEKQEAEQSYEGDQDVEEIV